jgi:hypothetical protein
MEIIYFNKVLVSLGLRVLTTLGWKLLDLEASFQQLVKVCYQDLKLNCASDYFHYEKKKQKRSLQVLTANLHR